MDFKRKFIVDSLIFSLPPPPTNDTPSAAIANASAVTSAPQTSSFPPPPPTNQHHKGTGFSAVAVGAGIGFGGAIMLVIMGSLVIWYLRRKRDLAGSCEAPPHKTNDDDFDGPNQQWMHGAPSRVEDRLWFPQKPVCLPNTPSDNTICSSSDSEKPFSHCLPGLGLGHLISTFTFEELAFATDGFSSNNLLGVGGFGYVHKGIFSNGKEVAVKQLKTGSGQGEREFQSEVETISRIKHKHLVSLVGYCSTGDQRLLVYEFVPNKTLDFHIHGKRGEPHLSNWAPLNWAARMKVALGSAKGLAFLHEDCQPKIIHRDIKAANILLDNSFEAKVSDFGLARFTLDTDTHVSTRVIGTFGYIAPEYAQTGKLTVRSDVFSFGVMLLELITGRRPIDKNEGQFCKEDNIVDWARPLLTQAVNNANFDTLADARLPKDYNFTEMSRMVTCAAACVRHLARLRPKMSQIVQALEGKISLDVLKEGRTMSGSSLGSSDFDSVASMHDKEKFRKLMYKNLENSSEYSGLNSDFTQQPSVSSSEFPQGNRYMDSSGERGKAETNQNTQSQEIGEKR